MKRKSAGGMQHKEFAFKADDIAADGTFKGYGSVFGNLDSYREIVAPGAFDESLAAIKASGDPLPVLWQHDTRQPIGGYSKLSVDKHGLLVEGFLLKDDIPLAAQAYALMQKRIVKGLSIGYYVVDDSYDEKKDVRTLKKLDLREISVVTFPANAEAQVDSVKSIAHTIKSGGLPTLPEFEDFLREAGFSKSRATAIAGGGLSKLLSRGEPAGEKGDILAALRGFNLTL